MTDASILGKDLQVDEAFEKTQKNFKEIVKKEETNIILKVLKNIIDKENK